MAGKYKKIFEYGKGDFEMKTKLYAYFFLPAIVYSIISVALPLFLASLGYAEDKIGNLYFITTLIAAPVSIYISMHSDSVGRKILLYITPILFLFAAALIATKSFVLIASAIFFVTIATSLSTILKISLPIEHFKKRIGEISGRFWSFEVLGGIFGTLAAGALMTYFGFANTFLITIPISLLLIIIALRIPFKTSIVQQVRNFKITKQFILMIIHFFAANLGFGIIFAFALPLYLNKILNLTYVQIGLAITLFSIATAAGSFLGKLSDKFNFKVVNYLSLFLTGALLFAISYSNNIIMFTILMLLSNTALGLARPTMAHFFNEAGKTSGRDIAVISVLGSALGTTFGSLVSGQVITQLGYHALFIFGGVIVMLSVLVLYLGFGVKK